MRPTTKDQCGFTLVELLVTLVIFGVVGGIVTSSTISALRSAASSESRIDALQELEIAMQRVTRDLRAADPLELVTGEYDDALGASIERGGSRSSVRYRLVTAGGVDQIVREDTGTTLITALDNQSDEPVFRYLDRFGVEIPCTTDCANAYLTSAQVQIRFVRQIDGSTPAIVESQVSVRNLRHGSSP